MDDAEYQNRHSGIEQPRAVRVSCQHCGMVEIPMTSYAQGILCPMCNKCLLRVSNNNSHAAHIQRSTDDREQNLLHNEDNEMLPHSSPALLDEGMENTSDKPDFSLVCDCCDRSALAEPGKTTTCTCTTSVMAVQRPDYPAGQNHSILAALHELSFQPGCTPQQETCSGYDDNLPIVEHVGNTRTSKTPTEDDMEPVTRSDVGGLESCSPHLQPSKDKLQAVCTLFKRGIISRKDLKHVLYIVPEDEFHSLYPRIKQFEAIVHHGTEFPMGRENCSMNGCALYHRLLIDQVLTVGFEMVGHDKNFTITSPSGVVPVRTFQIRADCRKRIEPGTAVQLLTKCSGYKDTLWEDSIRLTLTSGLTNVHMIFPIACYEANISPWLYDASSVTQMPQQDREALRSCHVDLINNIGDVHFICEYFYQYEIFNIDDIEEIRSISKPKLRNADFLRRIQTRGNILDLLIEIMRESRENQGAAKILHQKRCLNLNEIA